MQSHEHNDVVEVSAYFGANPNFAHEFCEVLEILIEFVRCCSSALVAPLCIPEGKTGFGSPSCRVVRAENVQQTTWKRRLPTLIPYLASLPCSAIHAFLDAYGICRIDHSLDCKYHAFMQTELVQVQRTK